MRRPFTLRFLKLCHFCTSTEVVRQQYDKTETAQILMRFVLFERGKKPVRDSHSLSVFISAFGFNHRSLSERSIPLPRFAGKVFAFGSLLTGCFRSADVGGLSNATPARLTCTFARFPGESGADAPRDGDALRRATLLSPTNRISHAHCAR